MIASRSLTLVALVGLLAASCSSAVIPATPGAALLTRPVPVLREPVSPPADVPTQIEDSIGAEASQAQPEVVANEAPPVPETMRQHDPEATMPPVEAPAPTAPPPPPPPADHALLGPLTFISQTVNNCGPASVAETLAFWGVNRSQDEVQSVLRGDGNPYGMTPSGVPSYAQSLGLDALLGTAGTDNLIKALLRAGFPVIVNQTVSATDLAFHYRPIEGFDDPKGVFISSDPLEGPQYAIPYQEFDSSWTYTGGRFMVMFPPDMQDALNAALAAGQWDTAYSEGGSQAQPWAIPGNGGPAPVTTPQLTGPAAANGWYGGPVTVALKATDPNGFGVAATAYAIDKQPVQMYRGPFTIKDAGKHTVKFYSVNFSGSREQDKPVDVNIDQTPPKTTAAVDGARNPDGAYQPGAHVTLTASDDVSGISKTSYDVDGGGSQTYSAPVALAAGKHTIRYSSVDQAGNSEGSQTLSVTVQAGTPASGQPGASPSAGSSAGAAAVPSGPPPAGGYTICPLYDQNTISHVGSDIGVKLKLCDAAGNNLSSPATPLAIQYIIGPPGGVRPAVPGAFHYDPGLNGYVSDVPPGPGQGTYALYFLAGTDPNVHMVQFRIG